MNDSRLDRPNPQFYRESTVLFNNSWYFSFDDITYEKINLPYCPQSSKSGINFTSFINKCYYRKNFAYDNTEDVVLLNFGAVDYYCELYVNDKLVGSHEGGYTSFKFDISEYLIIGDNQIKLFVKDQIPNVPSGKQSLEPYSYGCFYTRTTGIWQDVWLEIVPKNCIKDFKISCDSHYLPHLVLNVVGSGECVVTASFKGETVFKTKKFVSENSSFDLILSKTVLWKSLEGNLYDLKIEFENDVVYSYFGIRTVKFKGLDFYLNDKKTYHCLVMDQGFHPEGIYTYSSEIMENDIKSIVALGFNGVRMHQKVFPQKYLYLCDKYGLISWGEFASWGIDYSNLDALEILKKEWTEAMDIYYNHPSVVLLCPLNETWNTLDDRKLPRDIRYVNEIYSLTKEYDKTRPVVDVSGGFHSENTDLFDFHCYENISSLQKYIADLDKGVLEVPLLYCKNENIKYKPTQPVMLSECGGIALLENESNNIIPTINDGAVQSKDSWGYGNPLYDSSSFVKRYTELMQTIMRSKKISGICYTQLYDVEQEQNGFLTYKRNMKLSQEEIKMISDANKKLVTSYELENKYEKILDGYGFMMGPYFYKEYNQFYDFITSYDPVEHIKNLPSIEEVKRNYPNVLGWGTGIEDNNITASYMLHSAMCLYRRTKDEKYLEDIHNIVKGLFLNVETSKQKGFLIRNVHPLDGKTHYINSSRDQYTYWIFYMWRYYNSEFATDDEKERIKKAFLNFASKALHDVKKENNYSLLKEDGTPGIVCSMLKHIGWVESFRLGMIYLGAYAVTKDPKWMNLYKKYRESTLSYSENIHTEDYVAGLVGPVQMMYSMAFVYEFEEDADYKGRYLKLMQRVANGMMMHVRDAYNNLSKFTDIANKTHLVKSFREGKKNNVGKLWNYGFDCYIYDSLESVFGLTSIYPRVIAEGLIIQSLCPERNIPDDQIAMFLDEIERVNMVDTAFYYPSFIIGTYWLIQEKYEK